MNFDTVLLLPASGCPIQPSRPCTVGADVFQMYSRCFPRLNKIPTSYIPFPLWLSGIQLQPGQAGMVVVVCLLQCKRKVALLPFRVETGEKDYLRGSDGCIQCRTNLPSKQKCALWQKTTLTFSMFCLLMRQHYCACLSSQFTVFSLKICHPMCTKNFIIWRH